MNNKLMVDGDTRIAKIIAHPGAIEALIAVSSRFKKLKNPVLRKVMAGKVNVTMAVRISGVCVDEILDSLERIGLKVSRYRKKDSSGAPSASGESEWSEEEKQLFFQEYGRIEPQRIYYLDARPLLEKGKEPLSAILQIVARMKAGDGLCILNSFSPEPLVPLLKKKGLDGTIVEVDQGFEARFIQRDAYGLNPTAGAAFDSEKPSDSMMNAVTGNQQQTASSMTEVPAVDRLQQEVDTCSNPLVIKLNVVGLSPPQPMMNILSRLQQMKDSQVLYVFHEREPRFLFPHLAEQGYDYRISVRDSTDVRLLIGRKR